MGIENEPLWACVPSILAAFIKCGIYTGLGRDGSTTAGGVPGATRSPSGQKSAIHVCSMPPSLLDTKVIGFLTRQ